MRRQATRRFHVCNGDADGLCAVQQWRLHDPSPATLITGLKREIALLEQVPCDAADEVLVCDLSAERNRVALLRLLSSGARVRYFDHHAASGIKRHPHLELHIDGDPHVCTSLLMDRHLGGRFPAWAVVGAYGDALVSEADRYAAARGYDAAQRTMLRRLGEAMNYNAYGDDLRDASIAPSELLRLMAHYGDPFEMIRAEPIVDRLDAQRRDDLRRALAVVPATLTTAARAVILPDAPWSRRVCGCLANELAAAAPLQAQAVLRRKADGCFVVSVRAPRDAPRGADVLCKTFGGGGRASAAGIDALPPAELESFLGAFSASAGSTMASLQSASP